MSFRKKWRLKKVPPFTYVTAKSGTHVYELVDHYRSQYAEGMSNIHHVEVELNEGQGWLLFERIIFPERTDT